MAVHEFMLRCETRTIAVHGTASVVGDYDGPSKPEAMIRDVLAKAAEPGNPIRLESLS